MTVCTSTEWKTNMPTNRAPFQKEPFRFCPWCEVRLNSGQSNPMLLAQYQKCIKEDFGPEERVMNNEWASPPAQKVD
jgi:hypothetical protein